ncbi:MAG TPA: SH3 domain-containing protein [Rudaea sp.]|nr:SH3 domain-containing protein [Rudaea sp.]
MRRLVPAISALAFTLCSATACAREGGALTVPATGVIGVDDPMLAPDFWIRRLNDADRIVLDGKAIAVQNADLMQKDPTLHDLQALPATLPRKQVTDWIEAMSERPSKPMYDADGTELTGAALDALIANMDIGSIPEPTPARYALVVHRADLRTFPTTLRAFSERNNVNIDRFQESALFPGTPVVIVHASRDGKWRFVISPRYAAWVEDRFLAEGPAAQVFAYAGAKPYRIVTGATVTTVFSPTQPAISQLQLDMGVRVPLEADWPAEKSVDGQHPYTAHVIELPLRAADGALKIVPALLPKNADTQGDYLPLTRANILRQAFKFLGERYGWGHSYNARDCSGFVSDVYRSMGVQMPRNTRDQAVSPGLNHRLFTDQDDRAARLAAVRALQVGDLVYIPGHVMMAIGVVDGEPYVIHDTTGLSYRRDDGSRVRVDLNAVSVSPLTPLLFGNTQTFVDRMTSIVRIRPATDTEAPAKP